MSIKWNKTQFPGVRFRENSYRKHNGKPDRYFTIMVVGSKATPTKMAPAIAEIPVVPMMNPP